MHHHKIPFSIKEIKRKLNKIDGMNAREMTIENYEGEIGQLIGKIIAHSYFIPEGNAPIICRARAGEFSNVSDLMNPPPQYVSELGRMNDVRESQFYACIGPNAQLGSLDEIRVTDEVHVTQLYFRVKKKLDHIVGIGHCKHWQSNKPLNEISNLNLPPDENKKQILLTRWLHKEFLKRITNSTKDNYKKTIAISRQYKKLFDTKTILFPSVSSQGSCSNLVIDPMLARLNLEPVKARLVVAHKDSANKGYLFNYVKESENIDLNTGVIMWRNLSLFNQDARRLFSMADKSKLISLGGGKYAYPHPEDPSKMCVYSTMD